MSATPGAGETLTGKVAPSSDLMFKTYCKLLESNLLL